MSKVRNRGLSRITLGLSRITHPRNLLSAVIECPEGGVIDSRLLPNQTTNDSTLPQPT